MKDLSCRVEGPTSPQNNGVDELPVPSCTPQFRMSAKWDNADIPNPITVANDPSGRDAALGYKFCESRHHSFPLYSLSRRRKLAGNAFRKDFELMLQSAARPNYDISQAGGASVCGHCCSMHEPA